MKFNLGAKHDATGLTYIDDDQITKSNLDKDGNISGVNITFKKPYKIQIRATKMVDGERLQKKKTITFPVDKTLTQALKECNKLYEKMLIELENKIYNKDKHFDLDSKYSDVFEGFLDSRKKSYEMNPNKTSFEDYGNYMKNFHKKHLHKLMNKSIKNIVRQDLENVQHDILTNGFSVRTSLKVYEMTNPVFKFFNENTPDDVYKKLPSKKPNIQLNNIRGLDLTDEEIKEFFNRMKNHKVTPIREIFMFLMHGRRIGEVLTLQWKDIDIENRRYIIRMENNKARVDMTYYLSDRLLFALESIGIEQQEVDSDEINYVFKSTRDKTLYYNIDTFRDYFKRVFSDKKKIDVSLKDKKVVIHQTRNCVATILNDAEMERTTVGIILGHKQSKEITNRYIKHDVEKVGAKLDRALDSIFDEVTESPVNEKLEQLKAMFPDKTDEQLLAFIGE